LGTSLLAHLAQDPRIHEVIGIARRRPNKTWPKTEFLSLDVSRDDLDGPFRGADAVVHLAWVIQPERDLLALHHNNVIGSQRVFEAAARSGARTLIHASSVGAYSPGNKLDYVDESWPTEGIASSPYSRHKVEVERFLDAFEARASQLRVVRFRPALVFKRSAAAGIRKLFVGPVLPRKLFAPASIAFVPDLQELRFQAVHSMDVGAAFAEAVLQDVRGAFNLAAPPVLDPLSLSEALHARRVRVPRALLRALATLGYRLRVVSAGPDWLDLALSCPLMSAARAERELGWRPTATAVEALSEVLEGIAEDSGSATPPLASRRGFLAQRRPRHGAARA
jgi:nucleoside-diphosphate-sugar epimerase